MKSEYTKLEPSVLTIASSAMAGQRARHVFLNERHAAVVTKTNATITDLGKTINIDSSRFRVDCQSLHLRYYIPDGPNFLSTSTSSSIAVECHQC